MLTSVVLIVTLIVIFVQWTRKKHRYCSDRGIKQSKPKFLIGDTRIDRNLAYSFTDQLKELNGEPVYGSYNLLQPLLNIYDLELVKAILVKDFHYFTSRGMMHNGRDDPLSEHLFNMDGDEKWKNLRAKLSPTFTSGKMKYMFSTVVEIGERFDQVLSNRVKSGNELEMKDLLSRFTTDVIGTVAFGLECNSLTDPNAKFRDVGLKLLTEPRYPMWFMMAMFVFPQIIKPFHLKIIPDEVSEYFTKVVSDTVKYRVKNKIQRNDFMDLLINLWNDKKSNREEDIDMDGLSMEEITAQAFVFFLAGFETSSTAMSFTLLELAQNEEVQEKLRAEILSVLERNEGKLSYEAIKKMTYLDQCLNESMRKYPPVPFLTRKVDKPYHILSLNLTLPKDQMVVIPVYGFHHDPQYFPNPEKFDPDNFRPEKVQARNQFCYLPFGDGPRNCIGMRFGIMQAKIGLVMLLKRYKFKLSPKTELPMTFTAKSLILNSTKGMYFFVEEIKIE